MLEYEDETGRPISVQEICNITGQHDEATVFRHYDRRKMKRRFQIADAIAKGKPQDQILGPRIPSATITSATVTSATVESANRQSMMENESKQ